MSQAAIHYHLPYSSLYGRINRLKREQSGEWSQFRDYEDPDLEDNESSNGGLEFRWVQYWSWNDKEIILVILISAIFWPYPLIMMTGVMETTLSPRWPPTLHLWLHLRPKQPPQRLSFSLWPLKEEDRWEPWRAVRELTCRLDHYQHFQFRLVLGSLDHLYSIFQSALILLFD